MLDNLIKRVYSYNHRRKQQGESLNIKKGFTLWHKILQQLWRSLLLTIITD